MLDLRQIATKERSSKKKKNSPKRERMGMRMVNSAANS